MGAGRLTVEALPGIGRPEGVPSSPLTRRPRSVRWYEAWRVALRGWGSGEREVTGVKGLEGAGIELLAAEF